MPDAAGPASDEEDSRSDRMEEGFDNDAPAGTRSNTLMLNDEELESGMDSDSDDAVDPYGTRLDELFWEESDEGRRAPWLQGLSPLDCLREVFDLDAAKRGHKLTEDEMKAIRAHNYKVDTDLAVACFPGARRPSIATTPANADLLPLRSCPSEI
ncbi:hypothetical protein R3P38DRAFT_2814142 [Favolaschia claudopus]|uniref:Uncharacterized protein n=1 Tax=Favolaschia claudopus TaxID=2862362 RepID=A0AAV9Z471_9AGAR